MHRGRISTVPGHPYKANQALITSLNECFERTTRTHRHLPFLVFGEIVHLDHVDLINAHPFQRGA